MSSRVTVQDIADSLGLSRTTVSKVLNGSPAVSDNTRALVLNKARELNYRTLPQAEPVTVQADPTPNYFALVMHAIPGGLHIGTAVISGLDKILRQEGYSLITCAITDEEYRQMTLPPILTTPQIKAIVCIELFHPEYTRLLNSLGKPILFIDACVAFREMDLAADLLLMDSRNSAHRMLRTLIRNHSITSMGFVGDADHCISFRERYEAFLVSAAEGGVDTSRSIISADRHYGDPEWLRRKLEEMDQLPQLFFCANDFLAAGLLSALEAMGKQVPKDVMVCGFDGIATTNRLTTIYTPSDQIGTHAATILLHKIRSGSRISTSAYLHTKVIYRESAPESKTE